jgi:3-methylcrotonyl-CoA carboxylase alpha subunit
MSEKIVTLRGQQFEVPADREGIEIVSIAGNEAQLRIGDRTVTVPFAVDNSRVSFSFEGETYTAEVTDRTARTRARHRDHSMEAPMPGLILKIFVKPGDVVSKGTPLIVLEAMKMEHQIVAPREGTVRTVNCTEGELVQPGADLVDLQPTANG